MITAIDTNVLIDSLSNDPHYGDSSREALDRASQDGTIIISEVVYAEVAGQPFGTDELQQYLSRTGLRLVRTEERGLQEAGAAWVRYTSGRRAGIGCPSCGGLNRLTCQTCGSALRMRQHLVADFLVGAHAAAHADRLLSRDRGYYKRYFPGLTVIDPSL